MNACNCLSVRTYAQDPIVEQCPAPVKLDVPPPSIISEAERRHSSLIVSAMSVHFSSIDGDEGAAQWRAAARARCNLMSGALGAAGVLPLLSAMPSGVDDLGDAGPDEDSSLAESECPGSPAALAAAGKRGGAPAAQNSTELSDLDKRAAMRRRYAAVQDGLQVRAEEEARRKRARLRGVASALASRLPAA